MSEKLDRCPFCGSDSVRFDGEKHAVVCMRCKARGCIAPTEEASLDMWNNRAFDDPAKPTSVNIGEVATFPNVLPGKEQALKVLEEAAEVFGAWQAFNADQDGNTSAFFSLLDECADVIQAVSNLIAALNVVDFAPYMDDCRERNEKRGRFDGR